MNRIVLISFKQNKKISSKLQKKCNLRNRSKLDAMYFANSQIEISGQNVQQNNIRLIKTYFLPIKSFIHQLIPTLKTKTLKGC